MGEALAPGALDRWRREPAAFVTETMRDPETGKPFVLLDSERLFLEHAFRLDESGRLVYPEHVYSAPKKSGKTAFGAMMCLTATLVYGGRFAEGYCVANDLEQAQGRVFQACAASLMRRRC